MTDKINQTVEFKAGNSKNNYKLKKTGLNNAEYELKTELNQRKTRFRNKKETE